MHHKHRDGEMSEDFAGWHRRVIGHWGGAVYRALIDLDDAAVVRLNAAARSSSPLARLVSLLAGRLAAVEVALMLLLGLSGKRRSAMEMLLSVGGVYLACEVLGQLWPRLRPFERLPSVRSLARHASGRSFPSRHVASGLAMAAIGSEAHPRLGALMAAVAWVLGASRVVAGLHYPTDVVAGAALGIATTTMRRWLRTAD